jgi:hypothetical protein
MPTSVKRTTTVRASWPGGIKYFGATIGRRQRQNALLSSRVHRVLTAKTLGLDVRRLCSHADAIG